MVNLADFNSLWVLIPELVGFDADFLSPIFYFVGIVTASLALIPRDKPVPVWLGPEMIVGLVIVESMLYFIFSLDPKFYYVLEFTNLS